jgi:hypothetical protein
MGFVSVLVGASGAPGCGGDPGLVVGAWHERAEGGGDRHVVAPVHLEALDRPTRLTYVTDVRLPEAWRGRPLSFCIPVLRAHASLRVGGDEMPSAVPADALLARMGPQMWRIPARYTDAPELHLELVVEVDSRLAGQMVLAPRLSLDPAGDGTYRGVRAFSAVVLPLAPVLVILLALVHVLIWSLDRRQWAYFWFAMQGLAVAVYAALAAGLFVDTLGSATPAAIGVCLTAGAVGGAFFMHRQFGLGPVPRYIVITWAMVVVGAIATAGDAFLAERWFNPFYVAQGLVCVNHTILAHGRRMRGGGPHARSAAAYLMMAAWLTIALVSIPESMLLLFRRDVLGGYRVFPLANAIFAALQTIALGIEHARSLRDAEHLNEELRRKIEDRSRAILLALAQSAGSSPGAPAALHAVGDLIEDRYRIVRQLGQGGMGTVYEVERLTDGRHFAMKCLIRSNDTMRLARFAREAQIAARVHHPNLVSIVDVDVAREGSLFLVMELVSGGTLRDAERHFGERRWALRILGQIAEGLRELHEQGIVHRDLKPGNVLLEDADSSGHVVAKISDFGVSTLAEGELGDTLTDHEGPARPEPPSPAAGARDQVVLTRTGMLVGTPLFMAPEQARDARLATSASDVFSFGLVAYEVLTATRNQRGAVPTGFARLTPPLPPALAELLDRSLREEPSARPGAAELARALAASE